PRARDSATASARPSPSRATHHSPRTRSSTMRLILFRHGQAGDADPAKWPDDGLRPLTERGSRRTREAALGLARLVPSIQRIVSSPLERAIQTAAILHDALEMEREVEQSRVLALGGPLSQLLELLGQAEDDVV